MVRSIFHSDYREFPYWWEAYEPRSYEPAPLPREARVVIVGAGYAGLAAAVELHRLNTESIVIDAHEPGFGASTRSGGLVGGGGTLKPAILGKEPAPERKVAIIAEADAALQLVENLIAREQIACGWHRTGRFVGAWSRAHLRRLLAEHRNGSAVAGTRVVLPDEQREEIGSDFYFGGLVTENSGHLHPALYFEGLKAACERRGIGIHGQTELRSLERAATGWQLTTSRGSIRAGDVVIATNGYTGAATPQFQRRLLPLRPYIIATEELPADLAQALSPKNRALADTRRVVSFFRLSPDGRRMIFGSRVKWSDVTPTAMAALLFSRMTDRFPQLKESRITHAWAGNVALTLDEQPHVGQMNGLHYALGCNGNGIAMMTYLGTLAARAIAVNSNSRSTFDGLFPEIPVYNGRSRWFVPFVGNYLRLRDWLDRQRP